MKQLLLVLTVAALIFSIGCSGSDSKSGMPQAPTGLKAVTVTTTSAVLNWTEVSGATSYKVYRSTDGVLYHPLYGSTLGALKKPSYTDTGLEAGTQYYYRVTALTPQRESEMSNKITVIAR